MQFYTSCLYIPTCTIIYLHDYARHKILHNRYAIKSEQKSYEQLSRSIDYYQYDYIINVKMSSAGPSAAVIDFMAAVFNTRVSACSTISIS